MQEEVRMRELTGYRILDTPPEKEFDEIARIASAVCDTPMSLVTFIDSNRQWYKAKHGVGMNEVRRSESFCQHTLDRPDELLIVSDPARDDRFKNNRYVTGSPHIQFYAGAPLTSPSGNVMGTLCVMDSRRHVITEEQKDALKLLAQKAMQYLNMRKTLIEQEQFIEHSAEKLKKLTDLAPGVVFQIEAIHGQNIKLVFVSDGIQDLHPDLTSDLVIKDPEKFFDVVDDDDRNRIFKNIETAIFRDSAWSEEFRLKSADNEFEWYSVKATIEQQHDGATMYGSIHNITVLKQYEALLNQMLHDVSHVMRRPVTSMMGLASVMEMDELDPDKIKVYMQHIKTVFNELDAFTRGLNQTYTQKMKRYMGEQGKHESL